MLTSTLTDARPVPGLSDCTEGGHAAQTEGFEQLYVIAFPKVYAFIRSQVRTVETAQDIVGRIFLKAYQHYAKAPADGAALVWLFRIAHTVLIDHWRVDGRRDSSNISIEDLSDISETKSNPEAAYSLKERKGLLLSAIQELGRDDRALLDLKFNAQQTNREIAAILDLREAAVSMRLLRALRRVRAGLIAKGIERGR